MGWNEDVTGTSCQYELINEIIMKVLFLLHGHISINDDIIGITLSIPQLFHAWFRKMALGNWMYYQHV